MIYWHHMSLQETIKGGIKDAMKNKDSIHLDVLRGLSTAFMNYSVANGGTPQTELSDEKILEIIAKEAKKASHSQICTLGSKAVVKARGISLPPTSK